MKRNILIGLREKNSLSRKELAKELGISEEFVRKIESGSANPGRNTSLKFESFYQMSERVLFADLYNGKNFTRDKRKVQ